MGKCGIGAFDEIVISTHCTLLNLMSDTLNGVNCLHYGLPASYFDDALDCTDLQLQARDFHSVYHMIIIPPYLGVN